MRGEEHKEREKTTHAHTGGGTQGERRRGTQREKNPTHAHTGAGTQGQRRRGTQSLLATGSSSQVQKNVFFPSFLTGLSGNPVILQRKEQIVFVKEVVSFLSFHFPVKNLVIKSGREPPPPPPINVVCP